MNLVGLLAAILLAGSGVGERALAQTEGQGRLVSREDFTQRADRLLVSGLRAIPVRHEGRVKPLNSLARETVLFVTGRYRFWGLDPLQTYLGLVIFEGADQLELINVREPDVRSLLKLASDRRHFSVTELTNSPLREMAMPLIEREESGGKPLRPSEKQLVEVFHQLWLLQQVMSGEHLFSAVQFAEAAAEGVSPHSAPGSKEILASVTTLLKSLTMGADEGALALQVMDLQSLLRAQPMDSRLQQQMTKVEAEVLYTRLQIFFWAALLLVLLGILALWPPARTLLAGRGWWMALLPVVMVCGGLLQRVWITGFSPITNMYGTMVWVAFGILLFSLVLLKLYRQTAVVGAIWLAAGGVLLLTEGMPLILSPDLDPIMAVLRSNFWLTTHVLTITISYAAFSIAMLIGNFGLVRGVLWPQQMTEWLPSWSHMVYRMIQLGVFLLSVGIILGGVWADYSWGRFWGWDPKETWALIADIGFLLLLHGRHVGWIRPYGLLAWSPLAYLLVIMAWYGVNFILATGLHSYGFSSGGARMVVTYMVGQVSLVAVTVIGIRYRSQGNASNT